ncbi:probable Mrb1 - Mitochondrial p32 Family Protein [Melanopsichium pennsylvanicum]|uniref:Mitochondrial p32 family protein n=2 Tax=Melanopsichium pennsylvanicum TaxID=63383 RepID=A0A077RB27_9BASI|nr:mitochondrial p32 family protein [Melanopsichium pennsylvanicum 4]SNX87942.1 probable Mrb1 - Mitochondrial p32 Family Protein [Melanopsichium pennsylvanicum]
MIARAFSRTLLRAAPRSSSAVALACVRPIVVRFVPLTSSRNFSSSLITRGQGEADAELSAKLAQELSYEQENSNLFIADSPTNEPGFVTEFKQTGVWKITDKPGQDEVSLERDFGNEHIQVLFSVGDIDTAGPLEDGEEDSPVEMESSEQSENPQFPVRISATITKPSGSALMLDAFVQDGEVNVDNIAYYKDQELATRIDAEADFQRRGVYLGPSFETLDDALQNQFQQYLVERGIDANLALFIPNYAEYKEQREYCTWLANVRDFVEA